MTEQEYQELYEKEEQGINFRKYIFLFLSNWYWFALAVFIALGAAYLKNRYTNPTYSASATLILEDQGENAGVKSVLSELRPVRIWRRRGIVQNEIAKIKSYQMARRTLEKLNFNISYTAHGRIKEIPRYRNAAIQVEYDTAHAQQTNKQVLVEPFSQEEYRLIIDEGYGVDTMMSFNTLYRDDNFKFQVINNSNSSFAHTGYSFRFHDLNSLANQYSKRIKVENQGEESTIITLSIQGHVKEKVVDYLNTFCREYIQYGLDQKNQTAENTMHFIDGQISEISDSLRQIEKQLLNFREQNNIVNLSKEGSMAFERLKNYHSQKTEIEFKDRYYQYLENYLKDRDATGAIIAPPVMEQESPVLLNLMEELRSLRQKKEELDYYATQATPEVQQIEQQIRQIKMRIRENIEASLKNNQAVRDKFKQEITMIEQQIRQLPFKERALLNIQRKYDLLNKFYNFLLEKRAEVGIQKASNIADNRILDQARLQNVQRLAPNSSRTYAIALLLGLLIPGGFLFALNYFDNRIESREDIDNNTRVPVLGTIGHNLSRSQLPVYEEPRAALAESFRRIRTNLQYILREKDEKVIMVTSTVSGEGKTFAAANLATIMAMSNKKVLLAGLDLRRPNLHRLFGLSNDNGISTYLIKQNEFDDVTEQTELENLSVAVAGPVPPNPAELIETDRMKEFISQAREQYDYIILDTPPMALVTDAMLLGGFADSTIFLVRQKFSSKDVLELINNFYQDKKFSNINLLVNDIKASRALGYRYYYGYNYGYGYGYGYGTNNYYDEEEK